MSLNFDSIPYDPNFNTTGVFINKVNTFDPGYGIKTYGITFSKIKKMFEYKIISNITKIQTSFNFSKINKVISFNNKITLRNFSNVRFITNLNSFKFSNSGINLYNNMVKYTKHNIINYIINPPVNFKIFSNIDRLFFHKKIIHNQTVNNRTSIINMKMERYTTNLLKYTHVIKNSLFLIKNYDIPAVVTCKKFMENIKIYNYKFKNFSMIYGDNLIKETRTPIMWNNTVFDFRHNKEINIFFKHYNFKSDRNIYYGNDNMFTVNRYNPTMVNYSSDLNLTRQIRPIIYDKSIINDYDLKQKNNNFFITKDYPVTRYYIPFGQYIKNYDLKQKNNNFFITKDYHVTRYYIPFGQYIKNYMKKHSYNFFPKYALINKKINIISNNKFIIEYELKRNFDINIHHVETPIVEHDFSHINTFNEYGSKREYDTIKFKDFKFNGKITISKLNNIVQINNKFTYKIVQPNNNIKLNISFINHNKAIYPIISDRKYYIISKLKSYKFNNEIMATIITDNIHPISGGLVPIINYGRISSFISNKLETTTGRIS